MRFLGVLGFLVWAINCRGEDVVDVNREIYLYMAGRSVFEEKCSQCHGRLGKGDGEWAAGWTSNRPRNFRTGIFKFRSTPMGKLPADADLRRTISNGISGTAMPAFGNHLRDSDYEAVIVFLKYLSKRWQDPENAAPPVEVPAPPVWLRTMGEDLAPQIASGKALFSVHCVSCHGEKGQGDGVAALALMDVWGFKISPADLTREHHKSGARHEDLYRTIAMGLDGTPMIGFQPVLSGEQIWQLVAYIHSLKKEVGK